MRRLLPAPAVDVDPRTVHDHLGDVAPWVTIGMVSSVDGAATGAGGNSGDLGGEGDLLSFRGLRAVADAIVVGAGTARAEHYGVARLDAEQRARRRTRGQDAQPRIVVITRSLDLDGAEGLFDDGRAPLVYTVDDAPSGRRRALEARGAEVVALGDEVAPAAVVADLAGRGLARMLVEGGPTLNGAWVTADVIDRVCLTVAPVVVGGDAGRIVTGGDAWDLELESVHEHAGDLLLAWVRARPA